MSWSSPSRVLGICGVWLAVQTGCGGNPTVTNKHHGTDGGTAQGGSASSTGGTVMIDTGGENENVGGSDPSTTYACGNSELEPGEFCDDGNTDDGDGCSADCTGVDDDYDCSKVGETCVKVVICGNGVLEGREVCDDMNTVDMDGCAADCKLIEDGFACVRPGQPCVKVSVCGNGVRERGEQCDDGELPPVANDGCDDNCQIEDGYYCPNPGMKCVQQVCGDGVRTPGEACDDKQMPPLDNDGCSHLCAVEAGWHCNSMGCQPECGDGLRRGAEECDDNNALGGDGCSSACKIEPFFSCTNAEPSVCGSSIACGNDKVEPGEVCDPPGAGGCLPGCKSFNPDSSTPAVCGNSVIEDTETCDPPQLGLGCTAGCKVENGFTCPRAGACFKNPTCGDDIVQVAQGESCDPPNPGKGCTAACKVENGWTCVGLGPSTCVKPVCGNGIVDPGEQCDDGTNNATPDGCSGCVIGNGWACPNQGAACVPKCGDGLKLGIEQCDDGNKLSADGCSAGCKVEVGFKCPTPNAKCVASVCGDKNVDLGEGCDDGGTCVGGTKAGTACTANADCTGGGTCTPVAGDGCGPTCQPEPTVTPAADPTKDDPKVNVFCGDGLKTGAEACDDGNTNDGDGCQGDCLSVTPGWSCSAKTTLPTSLQMKITYRDFKSAASANGHPDFMYDNLSYLAGITGAGCTAANPATCGRLDNAGKPVLIKTGQQNVTGIRDQDSFSMWYRDGNPGNFNGFNGKISTATLTKTLTLNQIGGATSETYQFDAGGNNFYPIDGQGLGNMGGEGIGCGRDFPAGGGNPTDDFDGVKNYVDSVLNPANDKPPQCFCTDKTNDGVGACLNKNYGFTSELRYFFQYKGGETLTFSGDDDVWVFVNGKLAVDIGGLHPQLNGQVVLGDDGSGGGVDSNCSANGSGAAPPDPTAGCYTPSEQSDNKDARFNLTKGGVYEIVLFHAERHVSASNFKLTLAGFLAPRSSCGTICGDGKIVGDEYCDDGAANSDTASGACNTSCTARTYCGDGVKQAVAGPLPAEACDNGINTDLYKTATSPATVCAPGCQVPARCGDGVLQAGQGEQCDNGNANDDFSYGKTSCTKGCKLGGYCGDGISQTASGEACDLGANNGKTYGAGSCGYDCQLGARCGDHIRNGAEECDDGTDNGMATSHCDAACKIKPYCGDGIKQVGEECDYGQFASTEYGGCTDLCLFGPRCGDGGPGNTPDLEEECDYGTAANTGAYDGCTNKCGLGPRCGDAVVQADHGETCDNGFNADDYDDPKTPAAECGPGCTPPPFCGDKVVQSAYELCDNGPDNDDTVYDGCTTSCDFGPFCGDGDVNGSEICDDGVDNVSYAAAQGGCSYDCQPAPYCGDGERNGPEQCDLGRAANTGDYGTCNADCTFAPRCGDKKTEGTEQCDDGPTGSLRCTPTCKNRVVVQ
jgi:cysteine-rich repeat protein